MHYHRWCTAAGDALPQVMHYRRWCTTAGDALLLEVHYRRWCTAVGDALLQMMHCLGDSLLQVLHCRWRLRIECWGLRTAFSPSMAGLTFTLWDHKNPQKILINWKNPHSPACRIVQLVPPCNVGSTYNIHTGSTGQPLMRLRLQRKLWRVKYIVKFL